VAWRVLADFPFPMVEKASPRVADDPLHGPDKTARRQEIWGAPSLFSVTGTLRDRFASCAKKNTSPTRSGGRPRPGILNGPTSRDSHSREGSLLEGVLLAQSG